MTCFGSVETTRLLCLVYGLGALSPAGSEGIRSCRLGYDSPPPPWKKVLLDSRMVVEVYDEWTRSLPLRSRVFGSAV